MNRTHTRFLQSCKLFFALIAALFFINGTTYASHADLELTMTSPNANPGLYANVDIEITITNNGPEATENVLLEFPFPTDLPITGDPVESQGFFSNWWTGTGTWTVGTLAPGQTETVNLTLFTLAEDLFFYGQVVNSSVVDDDSTPDNGTPPTPSEDDEAVVAINDTGGGSCDLSVFISNITCDDNGTPHNPNDDLFSFDFTPENPAQPNGSWNTSLPNGNGGVQYFNGNYGESVSVTLPINFFPGGTLLFTVSDQNPSCSAPGLVFVPEPCSNAGPCSITATTSNIQCFDNGIPANDVWSFDMNVLAQNATGTWMANLNGQTYIGNFDEITQLGLFPVLGGDVTLTVFASVDSACSTTITVQAPPPCTDPTCNISSMGIDEVCDDNGTPNDPLDDVWFAHINPVGSGLGTTFSIAGSIQEDNLVYGQTYIFGPYPIQPFITIAFTITDNDNGCSNSFILDGTAPCSDGGNNCEITATVVSIDCNTMGNADPSDDVWSYIVDIDGTNTSNNWVIELANSPNNVTYTGPYSSNFTLENIPLTGPEVNVQTIMDAANPNCNTTISVNAPFPCNNANKPDLELTMTSSDQPGAFQNISYEVTVTNTGNAPANGIEIFGSTPDNVVLQGGNECDATAGNTSCQLNSIGWLLTTLDPGQSETLTANFFTLDANSITFYMQVTDTNGEDDDSTPGNGTPPIVNEDDEAAFTIGGGQPCQLSGPFYNNIQCFDNGTPLEADDFFDFEISVDGTAGGAFNLTTNAGVNGVFNYGQTITITGFPYANLPFSMSATDVNDPVCFLSQNNNGSFQPCSSGTNCQINYDDITYVCNDNGTSDSSDDTYVIELTAVGQGADAGTGWTAIFNNQIYLGTYGQVGSIGPFLINNGNLQILIQDNFNPDCNRLLYVFPPAPCSNGGGGDTDLKLEVTSNTNFAGSSVVVYTVTVTNEGPNDASGVSMQFDNGNSFGITDFTLSTGSYSFSTDIWSIGTIAAGTSETLILDDQYVDFSAGSLPTYPFFEILTMDNTDPDSTPGNDNGDRTPDEDDEGVLEIFPDGGGGYPADLSLNLSTTSTTVNLGETFSIFCNINLDGGAATTDVQASIVLPPTVQYVGFTSAPGSFNANTGLWDVGYIGGLTNAQIEITVILVDDSQPSTFFAQITDAGSIDFDSDPNNGTCCIANEDDESVLIVTTGGILKPDLTSNATVTVSPSNDFIDGTWTISNVGTAPSGAFVNRIYLSNDDQYSIDDTFLGNSFQIPAPFDVNQTEVLNFNNFALPAGLTPGIYYVLFYADQINGIDELDETNNIFAASIVIPGFPTDADVELLVSSNSTFQQWGYVAFDITISNTGGIPVSGLEIQLENIAGGVFQGGNEGTASAGTFYPVGGAPSHWDLSGVTILPNDSETLTINCFVLDPNEISVYAQVVAMNELDVDSSPNNGTPFVNGEDDESMATVSNASPLIQINSSATNHTQVANYQYFKIQNLYPNPVNAHLKIAVASATQGDAILQISNMQGNEVSYFKTALQQGQNVLEMDVSMLPKGIYFLTIETEHGMEVRRFLKG